MPCVASWVVVAAGEGGQSRSPLVPSGHRLREGTQRGLRGSYVFWVFMKRGMKSTVWWVFTKHQQRPFPRSRCEGAYPVCRSLHETFQPRPLSLPKPKTKTRQERRWCWGVISTVPRSARASRALFVLLFHFHDVRALLGGRDVRHGRVLPLHG